MEKLKHIKLYYVGFAVLIGFFMQFVLFNNDHGIGYLIFSVLYLIGFLSISYWGKLITHKLALLLIIPILVLSIDIALYNNTLVSIFVPIFLFILLFSFSVLLTLKNPEKHSFFLMKVPLFANVFKFFSNSKDVFKEIIIPKEKWNSEIGKKILYGVLYSIPILVLFLILFANADAVFESILNNKIFLSESKAIERLFDIILFVFYSIILASFFFFLLSKDHKLLPKNLKVIKLDKITSSVILLLVNVLFLTFVIVQLRYLFGDMDFVLENKIRFSEYARSGFFELIEIVIIAFLLIGFFHRSFSHHGKEKILAYLQIALVIQISIIGISALQRMELYQDAYGYTILRLYVEWFLYTVFFALAALIIVVYRNMEFRKLFHYLLIIGIISTTIVSSINVDFLIANKNIQKAISEDHSKENALDFSYLDKLSVDAVPAWLENKIPASFQPTFEIPHSKIWELSHSNSFFEFNLGRKKALELKEIIGEKQNTN